MFFIAKNKPNKQKNKKQKLSSTSSAIQEIQMENETEFTGKGETIKDQGGKRRGKYTLSLSLRLSLGKITI